MTISEEIIEEIPKLSHEELISRMCAAYFWFRERERLMELDGLPNILTEFNLYKIELLRRLERLPIMKFEKRKGAK